MARNMLSTRRRADRAERRGIGRRSRCRAEPAAPLLALIHAACLQAPAGACDRDRAGGWREAHPR